MAYIDSTQLVLENTIAEGFLISNETIIKFRINFDLLEKVLEEYTQWVHRKDLSKKFLLTNSLKNLFPNGVLGFQNNIEIKKILVETVTFNLDKFKTQIVIIFQTIVNN